jgi:hypothetical protein
MPPRADYPGLQFAVCRIALGVYLAVFFGLLSLYARELLSVAGVVPDVRMNLTQMAFPSVLLLVDSSAGATWFTLLAAVAAVLFAAGLFRRAAAAFLWYALACVVQRNTLVADPSTPFTGWLLLATIVVPPGEPLTLANRSRLSVPGWQFPRALFVALWIVLGVSYSVSGLIKTRTPEWIDGRAVGLFLAQELHRHTFVWSTLNGLPPSFIKVATWAGLGTELLAAPLALFPWTRPVGWLALATMHTVVLLTMRTTMLSLGAMLPLAFAFDIRWLNVLRRHQQSGSRPQKKTPRDRRHRGQRRA